MRKMPGRASSSVAEIAGASATSSASEPAWNAAERVVNRHAASGAAKLSRMSAQWLSASSRTCRASSRTWRRSCAWRARATTTSACGRSPPGPRSPSRAGRAGRAVSCPPRGDAVLASVAFREGGTLLLGHLDTVWPRLRSATAVAPRCRPGERIRCLRHEGRDRRGLAVLAAMLASRVPHPISLLLVPDEETGSEASRELTVSVARRHRRVLVLEPSGDGAAKVARKGCGVFHVRFRAARAHAGLEPEKGASGSSSCRAPCRFSMASRLRSGARRSPPRVARAGSASNVVPEAAELTVDARAWSRAEAERVSAAPAAIGRPAGVSVGGRRLRPAAARADHRFGRALRARAPAGGGPRARARGRAGRGRLDGNFVAAAGIPTLDGLGPRGGGAHARDEHVLVADLPVRAALVAALVRALGSPSSAAIRTWSGGCADSSARKREPPRS